MSLGSIHEWVGLIGENLWIPPLHVLVHLAGRLGCRGGDRSGGDGGVVLWIGRRVWPGGDVLGDGIGRTLLVDARDVGERLWACEQALRAGFCAVLDASRVDCAGTRRLQLACEARGGVVLMARPEVGALSVSATRWVVRRETGCLPRWSIELVRRRGGLVGGGRWIVEFHHARGLECVSGDVERGSGAQARAERIGGGSRVRADPSRRSSA